MFFTGSPPRGRGKASRRPARKSSWRITPAWAGKRFPGSAPAVLPRDHPRVGGEKFRLPDRLPPLEGSPPRVRGKDLSATILTLVRRITPAWAGKSCGRASPRAQKGDHPRVGGEKGHAYKNRLSGGGSPPRGRGKGGDIVARFGGIRITPAWAGKRWMRSPPSGASRDHPRVGGEKEFLQSWL